MTKTQTMLDSIDMRDVNVYGRAINDLNIYTSTGKIQSNGHDHTLKLDLNSMEFKVYVLSLDMGYPIGVQCNACSHKFVEGDIVLAAQLRLVGWLGWHTRCMKSILNDSPLDEFEVTKQKLINGEDPFE